VRCGPRRPAGQGRLRRCLSIAERALEEPAGTAALACGHGAFAIPFFVLAGQAAIGAPGVHDEVDEVALLDDMVMLDVVSIKILLQSCSCIALELCAASRGDYLTR
jgi:hypothetical protein